MSTTAKPLTHRPSLSNSSTSALPGRSHVRNNSHSSHSLLTSSLNPNHRVTRRKSVNGSNANMAALTAALRDGDRTAAVPIVGASGRRSTISKPSGGRGGLVGSLPSPPSSLPSKGIAEIKLKREMSSSAIDDANDMSADDDGSDKVQKARVRRASDGQPLTKEGKKSSRVELRCEKCGKGYKHSSCLTKHLLVSPPLALSLSCRRRTISPSQCGMKTSCRSILLTSLEQMGAHPRVVPHLQAAHFEAPASSAARGCIRARNHERCA